MLPRSVPLVIACLLVSGLACSINFNLQDPTPTVAPVELAAPEPTATAAPVAPTAPATPPTPAPTPLAEGPNKIGDRPVGGPLPEPPSGPGMALVRLNNMSDHPLCSVYISPSSEDLWGENRLEQGGQIAAGESREWEILSGLYDLRADDCDQTVLSVSWQTGVRDEVNWPVLNLEGLNFTLFPNEGAVILRPGFSPDPHTVAFNAGGDVNVDALALGRGCTGNTTPNPDLRIEWKGETDRLRIFFVAAGDGDASLVVNDDFGKWHCSDDFEGQDPLVELNQLKPAAIDVWVGSAHPGSYVQGTLYITTSDYSPSNLP
jgi:hypothetical protein